MTEAIETKSVLHSPLEAIHSRLGAAITVRSGWSLPASYGDVMTEYAAVRESGAGLIDMSSRGRISVGGSEAVMFLNGLITNDMKTLSEHHWMLAAFPNVQGRLIASVRVTRLQEEQSAPTFLIDTEAATHEAVLHCIQRFTMAGDFRVDDVTNQTAMISLHGPSAVEIVRALFNDAAAPAVGQAAQASLNDQPLTIIRHEELSTDGFDFIVKHEVAEDLWQQLTNAGAQPVGYDAFEILRVEAGRPQFGVDMDETNVVTETGLDDAVSFTKGCYIGQEIIARIKYRGHVAKKLSGVSFEGVVDVKPGAIINSTDGKEIGRVTSVANSPRLGCTIALGYVKYDYVATGTKLKVLAGEEELTAEVVSLPFVRSPVVDEGNSRG